jgi:hypothetical protein
MKGCEIWPTVVSTGFSFAALAATELASHGKREAKKYRKKIFYQLSISMATADTYEPARVVLPYSYLR